ncbi:type II toxin-antitoxin system RelE/ParE family toxin [Agathobaculum sp. Marseille-P7918]|uniref:type II toxin-antitoxin system RelE/ParE family toxin n=1 Tax=Agathobaculum sp. Marseille-P7918 TaxID=2479843 RepID=UPI003561F53E
MKIEWLNEAHNEFQKFVTYYVTQVGNPDAEKLPKKILRAVAQLADFPEMGVLKYDTLIGKYGFRALFIAQYVCVYIIENDTGQTGACRRNEKFCSRPFSITLSPVSGTITLSKAPIASLRGTILLSASLQGDGIYIIYVFYFGIRKMAIKCLAVIFF